MSEQSWQSMLEDMQSSTGGGKFFFVQPGRTRVRLIPEKGTENDPYPKFFIETQGQFANKPKKRYILRGTVVEATGREFTEEDKKTVRPLLVPPAVVKKVLALLTEKYDLLTPNGGHGITILRDGKGINTQYDVMASPSVVRFSYDEIIDMPESLSQLDKEYRVQASTQNDGKATPATSSEPESDGGEAGW